MNKLTLLALFLLLVGCSLADPTPPPVATPEFQDIPGTPEFQDVMIETWGLDCTSYGVAYHLSGESDSIPHTTGPLLFIYYDRQKIYYNSPAQGDGFLIKGDRDYKVIVHLRSVFRLTVPGAASAIEVADLIVEAYPKCKHKRVRVPRGFFVEKPVFIETQALSCVNVDTPQFRGNITLYYHPGADMFIHVPLFSGGGFVISGKADRDLFGTYPQEVGPLQRVLDIVAENPGCELKTIQVPVEAFKEGYPLYGEEWLD